MQCFRLIKYFRECVNSSHIGPDLMASTVKTCAFPSDQGRTKWWKRGEYPCYAPAPGFSKVGGLGVSNDWCIICQTHVEDLRHIALKMHPGLEISAGDWSLTDKISQFDRQISSPGGHAWPVNFLIKKYVQKWSRFFISNFPKKCMSVYGAG